MTRTLATLIGLAMLISSDITAASNSDLRPQGIAAIKTMAVVRAATVATAQYTEYAAGPPGFENVVISYLFPPNAISAGTQVRVRLYGAMDGAVGGFIPTIWFNQPNDIVITQIAYGASGNPDTWIIDAEFSFTTAFETVGNRFGVQNSPTTNNSTSLQVRGLIDLKAGTPIAPPVERMNTRVTPTPDLVEPSQPVQLFVSIASDIAFTVHGGWMEAL